MSLEALLWAKSRTVGSPAAKLVLICMADHASKHNNYSCWAGRESIAKTAEMTPRSVTNQINTLEAAGFITREQRRRSDGSRTSDVISLNVQCENFSRGGENDAHQGENFSRGSENGSRGGEPFSRHEPVIEPVIEPKGISPIIPLEIDQAVSAWNTFAKENNLSVVQKSTKARQSALKARLKDCGGLEGWRHALTLVKASPFLMGQNDRGWTVSFDFLCRESSFTKLMEGGYAPRHSDTTRHGPNGGARSRENRQMDAFREAGREADCLD